MGDDVVLRANLDAAAIAARRAAPRVFLVDERGDLIAWSAGSSGFLPPEVHAAVRSAVAEGSRPRESVELVHAGAEHFAVRILPQHATSVPTFAVIVERFALRDEGARRA